MALNVYPHGNCCGANIIDGFWSKRVYARRYERSGYTPDQVEEYVNGYAEHHRVLEELKDILDCNKTIRGQFSVVLNNDQNDAFGEDLVNLFGFKLLYSDVSNPNHNRTDPDSRLWTYLYVTNAYKGAKGAYDGKRRVEMGLPEEPVLGVEPSKVVIPGVPPPPPPFKFPPANLPYGVPL